MRKERKREKCAHTKKEYNNRGIFVQWFLEVDKKVLNVDKQNWMVQRQTEIIGGKGGWLGGEV